MDFNTATSHLQKNAEIIRMLVQDIEDEQARWKPTPDTWSILEVINHLYDEEREDFREHLDLILHRPGQPWSRIAPGGWVTERQYNTRDLAKSLACYLEEREKSLKWLADLKGADWSADYETPWGKLRAGDMLASWVAHDILHMRQLVELKWAGTLKDMAPYEVEYAGEW
ncbi:MAG: DinB family protein [Anaerolineae bacterium]|nr:DinB family protein [Anaerolineae bacterium]